MGTCNLLEKLLLLVDEISSWPGASLPFGDENDASCSVSSSHHAESPWEQHVGSLFK